MKIYLNSEDLGKTITYKEENGKKNYLYCKEGFEICENAQYTEQLLKENAQLKKEIAELEREVEGYNEYFKCFACENFEEFQEFIGTFMLTPHEEQTYIRELENKVKQLRHEICEKIREKSETRIALYNGTEFYAITKQILDQIEEGE